MVSTNIKISQRAKLIKVLILSKILLKMLFIGTNILAKSQENSQSSQIIDETTAIAINGWDKLLDKINTGH